MGVFDSVVKKIVGTVADNTVFTDGATPIIQSLSGVYQSTVTALTAGRSGLARLSSRRGQIVTPDFQISTAIPGTINANPKLVDDVAFDTFYSLMLGSTNGSTYSTLSSLDIPLAMYGWRDLSIFILNGSPTHDQNITIGVYLDDSNSVYGKVGEFILTQTNGRHLVVSSGGDGGLGAQVGESPTAQNYGYYSIQALHNAPRVRLTFTALAAPTAGAFARITVQRMT